MATGNWGQPDVANTDAMQGPAQISAVADYAAASNLRHFATVAALNAATGMLDGYYAVVDATPGALWRYDAPSLTWKMYGAPQFATATARSTALPAPVQGMRSFLLDTATEWVYLGVYNASTNPGGRSVAGWYPTGAGLVPIAPTSVAGTGVTLGARGVVTFASTAAISLNGCFSTSFDNYHIEISATNALTTQLPAIVLRAAGADSAAANYDYTLEYSLGTAQATDLLAKTYWQLAASNSMQSFTAGVDVIAPALPQLTTIRSVSTMYASAAAPLAGTLAGGHRLASAFDGFSLNFTAAASGTIRVYGYNNMA